MCTQNPISGLLNEIEQATKNTNLTVQDVLNVARHLFYRTHERKGPLKSRSRETLKPLVRKYGIGDRKLRAILRILANIDVLDLRPRISRPGKKAHILLEYVEQLPPEPEVPDDIWSELERATVAAGIDLHELRAVLQHLFFKSGTRLVVKGRDKLVHDLNPYNIGGRKLRRMLHHLEAQGILVRKVKNRFPSAKGEKLYHQLLAGEVPVGLPKISERLTVDRVEKEQAQEQYLANYRRQYGGPPSLEEAKRLLEEIWSVPSINRQKIAQLLREEIGVAISDATISKYKLGKRTMPEYMRAAIHVLHRQLKPERLAKEQEKQRNHWEQEEEKARQCLQELFRKGLPYSEITKKLRQKGLDISRDILYHLAQGSMRIYPNQAQLILKLWQEIDQEYPEVPTPKETANMLKELGSKGYSLTEIAARVYEKLPSSKKEIISQSSMRTMLRRFKEQPERKKKIHLAYRIAVKRVFDELAIETYSLTTVESRLNSALAAENLPIDFHKSQLTKKAILKRLSTILIAKKIQDLMYNEFKHIRVDKPNQKRIRPPIGCRKIAVYAQSKDLSMNDSGAYYLENKLEEAGFLEKGWLIAKGASLVDSSIEDLEELFEPEIFYLTRIKGLDFETFNAFVALLKRFRKIEQSLAASILGIEAKTFYTVATNLSRLGIIQKDSMGNIFLSNFGDMVANNLSDEFRAIFDSVELPKKITDFTTRVYFKACLADILFDYFLKLYYPHHTILERAAPWGETGIDRVLKIQNEIIAVELKSGTTNSTSWREEKTLRAILLRLSQIKEEYGNYPPYSLLLTSAKVGRDVRIIRWVTGQHRKHYISSSPFPFLKNRIENGVWSLKIPYRPPEEKMVPDHGWREKCKSPSLRNHLWVEVQVIGEEKICSVLQGNQDALELLWILQKPFSLLRLPKDINKEISEWRNKLT